MAKEEIEILLLLTLGKPRKKCLKVKIKGRFECYPKMLGGKDLMKRGAQLKW